MKVSTLIITSNTNHWTNSRSKWWGLKVLLKGAWELHTSYWNALLYKLWKLPILHHTHAFHNVHSVCSGISLHLWPNFFVDMLYETFTDTNTGLFLSITRPFEYRHIYCNATRCSRYPPTVNDCTPAPPLLKRAQLWQKRTNQNFSV